uniref:Pepsin inhibitor-3-like repeated domain-containing protein n=2 Tax=Meloidogyne TaxID=189290 RepID=A0A914LR96_MELIC
MSRFLFFKILFLNIFITIVLTEQSNNRAKRFISGFSPFGGGNFGCVVSGGKLYINGRFTKNLSETENEEMEKYIKELGEFKESAKTFIEQQKQQQTLSGDTKRQQQPEPPKRPSFCSENATTQFVFDGCTVQGDYVYIGDKPVRKLNEKELEKLEKFKQEFSLYQEFIANKVKKHMEKLFSSQLPTNNEKEEESQLKINNTSKEDNNEDINLNQPKEPKSPEFCVLIV